MPEPFIHIGDAVERPKTAVYAHAVSIVSEVDGRVSVQFHDADHEVFAFATLTPMYAASLFGQAQAWCHEATIGRPVHEQVGRA